MRKTTIYLDDADDEQLKLIKAANGLTKDVQAIRLAIRTYRSPRKK